VNDDAGVGLADAARAALDAHAGATPVCVVTALQRDTADIGPRRMLVYASGEVRGSLGEGDLDAQAKEMAVRALVTGMSTTADIELELELEHGGARYTINVDPQRAPDELLIVGAGHIALPLAQIGALLGFQVTVLDDRDEMATIERFPDAARVLRVDFSEPFRTISLTERTYIVLVTRAHKYDFDCLRDLVNANVQPRYIGMVGSKRRVRAALGALLDAGVPRDKLERVRTPVGLDIAAETPAEIAVSIAAELVLVRRGDTASGVPIAQRDRVLDRLLPEASSA
jgi:xanthine dehydrogenase accessory factor